MYSEDDHPAMPSKEIKNRGGSMANEEAENRGIFIPSEET
jgi:hypothetical protein